MLKTTRHLTMFDATEIKFSEKKGGKETGETISKWKYQFIGKDGNIIIGYGTTGSLKNDVADVENYDERYAKDYVFTKKVWDGITKEQLIEP